MLTRALLAVAVATVLQTTVPAGEYNEKLKIGDPAPAWTNLPGVDGKRHSLADLKDKQVVVLIFTCNSCPVAVGYEDRIIAFAKKYADKSVAVVAVNVNTVEDDRLDKMRERAQDKAFPFAYLYDESQKIAKDYGAGYTPEFFVLDRDRRIAYMGAMDDVSPPRQQSKHFLDDAVQAVLAGRKPPVAETRARGCAIRFTRPKR
jgi:peroxiredoxin